ncbi:MAG: hypothetical protein MUC88_25585 [Planctomycetes bacterium]|nr:hypothetical protein [Planctomycetota bacterium]
MMRSVLTSVLLALGTSLVLGLGGFPVASAVVPAPDIKWTHLSSTKGDLAVPPGGSQQQTGAVIGDFDGDGVKSFVLSFRQTPPALVWYRRHATGWDQYVIERDYLTIEAGGAVLDIDGDGDLDLLNKPYTWEAPRVDVWLNDGTRRSARGVGTSGSFHGPTVIPQVPRSLRYLESLSW